ncbi:MICOS complex subunit Mic19 [Drosophila biarmipes]|uniref:MICOS complex subunit Mic19 n=1 Tax=Drosophila biarmipes TaxID=125945 RepID=UPI0007E82234|nr:MICOS complex subunit Mic19 [Drosophila biarmipes]
MGAQLAGETRAEGGGAKAEGAEGVAEPLPPQQPKESAAKQADESKKSDQEEQRDQDQEHPQPQLVSMEHRSRSGSITSDIQRMPTEAIYAEFERLVQRVEGSLKEVAEPPCSDVAARLQSCLQAHRQRSCHCFPAMEQYRHCVLRATQSRVDDLADRDPPKIPVMPPQPMPRPAVPPPGGQRSNRRWWKFWTWFR